MSNGNNENDFVFYSMGSWQSLELIRFMLTALMLFDERILEKRKQEEEFGSHCSVHMSAKDKLERGGGSREECAGGREN